MIYFGKKSVLNNASPGRQIFEKNSMHIVELKSGRGEDDANVATSENTVEEKEDIIDNYTTDGQVQNQMLAASSFENTQTSKKVEHAITQGKGSIDGFDVLSNSQQIQNRLKSIVDDKSSSYQKSTTTGYFGGGVRSIKNIDLLSLNTKKYMTGGNVETIEAEGEQTFIEN